jgi:hypothetical protein
MLHLRTVLSFHAFDTLTHLHNALATSAASSLSPRILWRELEREGLTKQTTASLPRPAEDDTSHNNCGALEKSLNLMDTLDQFQLALVAQERRCLLPVSCLLVLLSSRLHALLVSLLVCLLSLLPSFCAARSRCATKRPRLPTALGMLAP